MLKLTINNVKNCLQSKENENESFSKFFRKIPKKK